MEILLVEDDLEDAGLTMEALKEGDVQCRVSLVRDGEEALEFVRRQGKYRRTPQPDIILLDMQLPKLSGREVLAEIKNDGMLERVPIVVLTSSPAQRGILENEKLHVDAFLTKPVDVAEFISAVRSLRRYWLADVILPQ